MTIIMTLKRNENQNALKVNHKRISVKCVLGFVATAIHYHNFLSFCFFLIIRSFRKILKQTHLLLKKSILQ